jgi:enediyne biosynthesis protein E4
MSFIVASVLVAACSSTSTTEEAPLAPPPRICKPPKASPQGAWFTDVTSAVGLGRGGPAFPLATNVIAADLDGDGFADILTLYGGSRRGVLKEGPYAGKQPRGVFMSRPDPNNPGARIFVDETVSSGLLATRDGAGDRGYSLVNAGDLDNDGDVDLVLCNAEPLTREYTPQDACEAFLNDGKGHFKLAEPSALGAKVFWSASAALFDYDRDGILDFWPATIAHWPYDPMGPNNQKPLLFRGNGDGTFENVAAEVGLPTKDGTPEGGTEWRHTFGVTVCDLDGDGDDDVVLASYGRQENWVFRNEGGTFKEVASELGLDHDGRVDYRDDQSYLCYCAQNPAKCPADVPPPTARFCSAFGGTTGRGWYPGVTDQKYALGGNHFSFACGDIDDDGDMDLVSATIVHGDVGSAADPTELIVNPGTGGRFERPGNDKTGLARPANGIYWNHGDDMAVMVDVDLDGKKDIFTTTTGAYELEDHACLWRQKDDRTFEEIAIASGLVPASFKWNLHGPAWIDIDGDGDLDLVVGDTRNGKVTVLRNDVGQDRNFLRVRLVGKGVGGANVSAVGAKVRVKAGGRTQTEYVRGGYGQGNVENDLVLTFGLGDACDIESVEVAWPNASKTVTVYEHVLANYAITIREGAREVEYPSVNAVRR